MAGVGVLMQPKGFLLLVKKFFPFAGGLVYGERVTTWRLKISQLETFDLHLPTLAPWKHFRPTRVQGLVFLVRGDVEGR